MIPRNRVVSSPASSVACTKIPQDGLVASYLLQGTAEDEIGTYNGTETSMTYAYDDERGIVSSFDGSTGQMSSTATVGSLSSFSITTWIKTVTLVGSSHTPIWMGVLNNELFIDSDASTYKRVRCYIGGVQKNLNLTTDFASGSWVFVTIDYDGVNLSTTLDTVANGSVSASGNVNSFSNMVLGGRNVDAFNYNLTGGMGNTHIYNRALTAQEVTDIYNLEKYQHNNALDHGLVAYYPLDGNSLDNAINQYDGTDTGVTYVADGTFGTVLSCGAGNISIPTATGFVEQYYWEDTGTGWTHIKTTTQKNSFTTNKYAHIRKYNRAVSAKELSILQDIEKELICPSDSTINNPDPFEDGSGIALYKMDGNANDTTGVYDGTPTNITYADGVFGQSAVFTNALASVDSDAVGVKTVSLKASHTVKGTNNYIFDGRRTAGTAYCYMALTTGIINFVDCTVKINGTLAVSGTTVPTASVTNHYVIELTSVTTGVTIGLNSAKTSGLNLNGNCEQIRFLNRAITASEVTKLDNERKV